MAMELILGSLGWLIVSLHTCVPIKIPHMKKQQTNQFIKRSINPLCNPCPHQQRIYQFFLQSILTALPELRRESALAQDGRWNTIIVCSGNVDDVFSSRLIWLIRLEHTTLAEWTSTRYIVSSRVFLHDMGKEKLLEPQCIRTSQRQRTTAVSRQITSSTRLRIDRQKLGYAFFSSSNSNLYPLI